MDRNQPQTLMYREGETIAEILQAYRQLILISTDRITNKASIGQAAHNSMAMQLETQRLIKGVENLHALTRRIRELWIVGSIRQLDEGGRELNETIASEVKTVTDILNQVRGRKHDHYTTYGAGGEYEVAEFGPLPPMPAAPPSPASDDQTKASADANANANASAPTNTAAPPTSGPA